MSNHDSMLFCNEGSQHVKRASSRVTQPPGGRSTFSLFGGGDEPPAQPTGGRRRFTQDMTANQQSAPLAHTTKTNVEPTPPPQRQFEAKPQVQQQQQQQYSLYCNEGGQLRNRPAKKVLQPPGGASSIFG